MLYYLYAYINDYNDASKLITSTKESCVSDPDPFRFRLPEPDQFNSGLPDPDQFYLD